MICATCRGAGLVAVRHPVAVWEIMAAGLMDFQTCPQCEGAGLTDPPEYHICDPKQCCASCERHVTPHEGCIMR